MQKQCSASDVTSTNGEEVLVSTFKTIQVQKSLQVYHNKSADHSIIFYITLK